MKKLLSILLSAAVIGSLIPVTAAADDYINKSDNFESYTVGDDWKQSVPAGWRLFSSGDTETAEIKIVADPENTDNKVLKIKGISQNVAAANPSGVIYDRIIFQSNGGSSYAPNSERNIVLRTKCYLDGETVSGLPGGSSSGTAKNMATINAIGTNSQGNPFSILYLRKDENDNSNAVIYKRSGKYGSDYYADVVESFPTGRWVEVVHVLSTANGLAEYKQYIDGTLTVLTQENGEKVFDLKANGYDGNASSSVVTNVYGLANAVITSADAAAGKEPTMYIDDVAIYEVDASKRLNITNQTSDEVINEFAIESDTFEIEFSEEISKEVLLSNIYVADGDNKYTGAEAVLAEDGKSAQVSVSGIEGLTAGNTYKLCVDIGMHSKQYIPIGDAFEMEFTLKESEEPSDPDPTPTPTPTPTPEGVLMNELVNENMESYDLDQSWLSSAPAGWQITQNNGTLSDAEVKIVSDPADENNKVLKITPGMLDAKNNENISVYASTGAVKTTDENLKKILVKMKVYIPSETVSGMPDGTMAGKDYSALGGISMSSTGANLFSVSTLRKEAGDDGTLLKMYARTGATSAEWYADKLLTLPLDRWFEFAHVVDISDKGENADFPTYWYKQYVDGVPTVLNYNKQNGKPETTDLNRNSYTGVPFKDGYFEYFNGVMNRIAVAPNASVAPVIYIDDVYAATVEEYAPQLISGAEGVSPYSDIVLELPADFTDDNMTLLNNAVSVERIVYDENSGEYTTTLEKGTFTVSCDENRNLTVKPENGLKYNTDYILKIDPSLATSRVEGIYDKNFMIVERTDIVFSTKKAEDIFIDLDSGSLDLGGAASIPEADSISYRMTLKNQGDTTKDVITAMVVYGKNNKLLKADFAEVTAEANSNGTALLSVSGLGGLAEYAALFVFADNQNAPGAMLQVPDILK